MNVLRNFQGLVTIVEYGRGFEYYFWVIALQGSRLSFFCVGDYRIFSCLSKFLLFGGVCVCVFPVGKFGSRFFVIEFLFIF